MTPSPEYLAMLSIAGTGATVRAIRNIVCAHYGVTSIELESATRSKNISLARHVAMLMLREGTTLSLPEVARLLKRTDHTTVMWGIEKAQRVVRDETLDHLRSLVVSELMRVAA